MECYNQVKVVKNEPTVPEHNIVNPASAVSAPMSSIAQIQNI